MPHCLNPGRSKDFNGLPIVFRGDGYINMTKAAKHFGKPDPAQWLRQAETSLYFHHLSKAVPGTELIIAKKGRYGGTWGHPKVAVKFARWLSVEFEVWCDLMIDNILQGNIQTSVVVPTQAFSRK